MHIYKINAKALGSLLYLLRGMQTQKEIAARIGVSREYYSKIELGTKVPTLEQLISLCSLLGIHPGDVLKRDGVIEQDVEV